MSEWGDKIPNGWGSAEIQEIGEVVTGSTPAKKDADNYDGGDIPFYKPTDLNAGYFVKGSNDRLTEKGANLARVFPVGSVMVTCIGATIGKTGLARTKGASNQQINTIIPSDKVNSEYLYWLLSSPLGQNSIIDNANATTLPILNKGKFSKLRIPIAPLPEQRRIVSKIEELFSKLDAGVAALKQAKAQLKRYRQSVLAAAVTGELTKEWRTNNPNTEPASILLERILEHRRETWTGRGKYKEPDSLVKSNLASIPASWLWASLESLTMKITDGEHFRPKTIEEGIPFLSAKDVRDQGVVFDNPLYVSREDAERFRNRCGPDKGDVLIVSRGATVGRCCVVQTTEPFCLLGSVILLKSAKEISGQFLLSLLKSPSGLKQLTDVSGSTAQQAIYLRDIKSLSFPLPPIAEQKQIVAEVEARTTIIDHIEAELDQQLTRSIRLKQSILSSAFSGKI